MSISPWQKLMFSSCNCLNADLKNQMEATWWKKCLLQPGLAHATGWAIGNNMSQTAKNALLTLLDTCINVSWGIQYSHVAGSCSLRYHHIHSTLLNMTLKNKHSASVTQISTHSVS
jgi:hypothetical protein